MAKGKNTTEARKALRVASHKRGEERKKARREAQAEREARNKELRYQNLPTPWELAKVKHQEKKFGKGNFGKAYQEQRRLNEEAGL